MITLTKSNQIFVFGSNPYGNHFGGAAKYAVDNYGAIIGQPEGLQGRSYAIDTMSGLHRIKDGVSVFLDYARCRPWLEFVVTPIGCGIAGYTPDIIAPLFEDVPINVILPVEFLDVLRPTVYNQAYEG